MSKIKIVEEVPATPHFDFISGRFDLGDWTIPYFTTTMSIPDAAESLRLVTEFPGWEEQNWSLEELFQRDVDWKRVEHRIVPYLKDVARPQFFNSLTVALIPLKERQVADYDRTDFKAPGIDHTLSPVEREIQCGPISLGYWSDWDQASDPGARVGRIRWNPREVFCAAIDGQHRLAALKRIAESERAGDTTIPVILLVFDEQVGFRGPDGRQVVPILRKLFIDLNKHAVKVGRSRLILLDDLDPTSLCVRKLVGERLEDGLDELEQDPPRLPLSLIDWHSDSAKFDDGPYLGTILGLDHAVQTVLGIRPITDYTNEGRIRKQLKTFERELKVDLADAKARLKTSSEFGRPFHYKSTDDGEAADELTRIAAAFGERYAPALVHLLTYFDPYDKLVRTREEAETANPLFVQWYQLYSRKESGAAKARQDYDQLILRLQADQDVSEAQLKEKLSEIERQKGTLAFNVVFQRALFRAFSDYAALDSIRMEKYEKGALWREDDGQSLVDDAEDLETEFVDDELDEFFDDLDENDDEPDQTEFAEGPLDDVLFIRASEFVDGLNLMVRSRPAFLDVRADMKPNDDLSAFFWAGTLLRADSLTIDFALDASRRAADLLILVVCLYMLISRDPDYADFDADDIWSRIDPSKKDARLDTLEKRARRALRSYQSPRGNTKSAAERILQARQLDPTPEKLTRITKLRFDWLAESLIEAVRD